MGLLRDWGLALVVVVGIFVGYEVLFAPSAPSLGDAQDFTLTDLEGRDVQLSSVSEDVVVLNFWFTSCPPCRAEIPELTAFAAHHPDVGVYGISTDLGMPLKRLARESAALGIDYPVLHDVKGDVARAYGVSVFPTTVVVRDMQIVKARVGAVDHALLESMIAAAR